MGSASKHKFGLQWTTAKTEKGKQNRESHKTNRKHVFSGIIKPHKTFRNISDIYATKNSTPFVTRDSLEREGGMTSRPDPVQESSIYHTQAGAKPFWEWYAGEWREHRTSPSGSSSRISSEIQGRR